MTLDTSEFNDDALALVAAALAALQRNTSEERAELRRLVRSVADHDRKLHRHLVLYALAITCAQFLSRLAEQEGTATADLLDRYRESLLLARFENELE